MDINDLNLFIEVARRGSFAAVARDQNRDPSSVSRIIAALEDELGLRLFQRTTRRMTLTEAGEVFLTRIAPVADEISRAREEAASLSLEPGGLLRLSASVAFGQRCLIPLLPAFRAAYPKLRIDLVLTDQNIDLIADRIDLAIRLAPAVEADLIAERLSTTRYHLVASPGWISTHEIPRTPDDMTNMRCLLFNLPDFRSRWMFRDTKGIVEDVAVSGDIMVSSAMALRQMALLDLGPALLANWLIADDVAKGRLIDLFPDHQVAATSFDTAAWLIYPSRAFLPQKVRTAIDFLKKNLPRRWKID